MKPQDKHSKKSLIELPAHIEFGDEGEHRIVFSNESESKSKPFRSITEALAIMKDAKEREILQDIEIASLLKALVKHGVPPIQMTISGGELILVVMSRPSDEKKGKRQSTPRPDVVADPMRN